MWGSVCGRIHTLGGYWGKERIARICPADLSELLQELDMVDPNLNEYTNVRSLHVIKSALSSPNITFGLSRGLYLQYQEALMALQQLSRLKTKDIFAFRETWTDADTELLRKLDDRSEMWVQSGNLTTESFAEQLPSIVDFEDLVSRSPLAVVGGADSLENSGFGPEIDQHTTVARFNQIVGNKLAINDTGVKTDMHVMCAKVPPLDDIRIPEMDLETNTPWRTYCERMHRQGQFAENPGKPFVIRPTAMCFLSLDPHFSMGFTRGFLLYWFVARLFDSYDMYGFRGHGHYKNVEGIHERYLHFEHFVYDLLEPTRPDRAL